MSVEPTLSDALLGTIWDVLDGVHTAMPGRVESYDATTQTASVKPLIRMAYADETGERQVEDLPVINGVPVAFPRAGGYGITFPISKGDGVLLVFSEGSIDKWLKTGGVVDPIADWRFDVADAIAIPGLFPNKGATSQVAAAAAVLFGSLVQLGGTGAADGVIKGTSYAGAEQTFLAALGTYLDLAAAGWTALSGLLGATPNAGSLASAGAGVLSAAASAFSAAVGSSVSTKVTTE